MNKPNEKLTTNVEDNLLKCRLGWRMMKGMESLPI
jgi:hypothetical protein